MLDSARSWPLPTLSSPCPCSVVSQKALIFTHVSLVKELNQLQREREREGGREGGKREREREREGREEYWEMRDGGEEKERQTKRE